MPCLITEEMLTGHRKNLIRRSRLRAESKLQCRHFLATQINLFPYVDRFTFSCERGEVALSRSFAAAFLDYCIALLLRHEPPFQRRLFTVWRSGR